jgi:hypothetical protein
MEEKCALAETCCHAANRHRELRRRPVQRNRRQVPRTPVVQWIQHFCWCRGEAKSAASVAGVFGAGRPASAAGREHRKKSLAEAESGRG